MFFKWENRYERTMERLENIRKSNSELYILNNRLSMIVNNLKNISEDKKTTIIDLYHHSDTLYCIVEQRIPLLDFKYEIFYFTYNLSNIDYQPICKLEASVNMNASRVTVKLDNIDTMYEKRKGHGTKQIQKLIKYSKDIGAIQISGELYNNTPIGLDNLKMFYIKNGFEIIEETDNNNSRKDLIKIKYNLNKTAYNYRLFSLFRRWWIFV